MKKNAVWFLGGLAAGLCIGVVTGLVTKCRDCLAAELMALDDEYEDEEDDAFCEDLDEDVHEPLTEEDEAAIDAWLDEKE